MIVERFLADLHELYPQTRGVIAGATVQRWELGNVYARPGRGRLQARAGGRARAPTRTCTWRATTSPSWGTWRPPPGPGSRPPNASTPESERSPMSEPFHGVLPALITPFTDDGDAIDTRRARRDRRPPGRRRRRRASSPAAAPASSPRSRNAERRRARRGHRRGGRRPRPGRRRHGRALDARDRRAERARRAGRRRRGDDRPAVLRRALVARAARALHGRRGRDRRSRSCTTTCRARRASRSAPRSCASCPIACLKDTGGDAVAATELIQTDGPTLLNGWDTLTFAALAAGVRAVVWGAASIVPEQCVELHRLLIDDIDLPAARELWARLWPLCQFLEGQSYSAAVKTACRLVGDTTGPGPAAAARRSTTPRPAS